MAERGTKRRKALWGLFVFAVGAGLCVTVAIFGGLNRPIRHLLQKSAERLGGGEVRIRSLEGNPLFRLRIGGVSWVAPNGMKLQLGEARVQYRPGWLLLGRLYIDSLSVISPQINLVSGGDRDLTLPVLPAFRIDALEIEHGVVSIDESEIAGDVAIALGFEHDLSRSRLLLRRMRSVVFDPPIEITNLDGILLREDNRVTVDAVRLSTVKSTCQVDGTIEWGSPPSVTMTARSDSRAAESPLTYFGIDAPQTDGWVSGTFSGPLNRLEIVFEWVAGAAAGEGQATGNIWHHPYDLNVRMTGRDVNLGPLVGVPLGGDVSVEARLVESSGWVTGSSRVTLAPASFLNGQLDSVRARIAYSDDHVDGTIAVTDGTGRANLQLGFDPTTGVGRLVGNVDRFDLAAFEGPASAVTGRIQVHLDTGQTTAAVVLDSVEVAGMEAGSLSARAVFTDRGGHLESLAWAGMGDLFRVSAAGQLTPAASDSVGGLDLRVEGSLCPVGWDEGVSPDSIGLAGRIYETRGVLGARSRWADLLFQPSSPLLGADSVRVTVELAGKHVRIDTMLAVGRTARYEASGSFVLDRSWDVAVRGEIRSLNGFPVPNWISLPEEATLVATAFGPWLSPDLEITVETDTLRFLGAPLVRPRLRLHRTEHAGLSLRAHTLTWAGRELRGLYADIVDEGGQLTFLIGNASASEDRLQLWGGALRTPERTTITVDSLLVRSGEVMVANDGPGSMTWSPGEGLRIQRLSFGGPGGSLLASSRSDSTETLDVIVDDVDLRPWAFVYGAHEALGGLVSGKASFGGRGNEADLVAGVEVRDFQWADLFVDSVEVEVAYASPVAKIELDAWSGEGVVQLSGSIPFEAGSVDSRGEIDLAVQGSRIDLSQAEGWVPWLAEVAGTADVNVLVSGNPREATGTGSVKISEGVATIKALAQKLSDVSASLVISPRGVEIEHAVAVGGEGRIEAVGHIDLTPFNFVVSDSLVDVRRLDLGLGAVDFKGVNLPEFQARVDADVRLTGSVDTPSVSGVVNFLQSEIRFLSMLETPADPESVWRTVPFFKNLISSLQLVAQNQVWVRDENLNVELNGDVDLLRDSDGVRLFGSLSSLRGAYRFQNRDFRIERGQIDFLGSGTVDPSVSIVGATRLPIVQDADLPANREDLTIRVIVGGTITQPEITLESDPPVGDQATILSYILLGRPPDDFLTGQQGVFGEQSAGLVVGLAANQLKERIGEQLNLDLVQLEMAGEARVSRVQVGKYISDRIFVSYDDPIGTDAREFTVEYELLPDLTLESRVGFDDEGDQKSKLFITWRKDW